MTRRSLAVSVGLLVVVMVVASWVLAGWNPGPVAPSSLNVNIANLSPHAGSIEWHSSGLLGTPFLGGSGTEPAPHCSLRSRTFAPGHEEIVISSPTDSLGVSLDAPPTGNDPVEVWFVIHADGTVEQTTVEAVPPSPYCPTV